MTVADYEALTRWFEEDGTARGARDAYASAVIFFVDNVLKATLRFYKMVPGLPVNFNSGINGVPTPRLFRYTSNNIRHYDEWRNPFDNIPKGEQAYRAVEAICKVLERPVPKKSELSVMAANYAWPIAAKVGGPSRTFDGFLAKVREFMDEMLHNAGMENNELVQSDIAREQASQALDQPNND